MPKTAPKKSLKSKLQTLASTVPHLNGSPGGPVRLRKGEAYRLENFEPHRPSLRQRPQEAQEGYPGDNPGRLQAGLPRQAESR